MKIQGREFDRGDLAREIASRYGDAMDNAQTQEESALIALKGVAAILPDALAQFGGRVEIHGLGTFRLEKRAARKGILNGVEWSVPERQEIVFEAWPALAEMVGSSTGIPTY